MDVGAIKTVTIKNGGQLTHIYYEASNHWQTQPKDFIPEEIPYMEPDFAKLVWDATFVGQYPNYDSFVYN